MVPTILVRTSLIMGLLSMIIGFAMGISQNLLMAPAHAHLNLVGFVALFLAALYYCMLPAAADSRLAEFHACMTIFGAVLLPLGIAVERVGGPKFFVIAGSIMVFTGHAFFVAIVFRHRIGGIRSVS